MRMHARIYGSYTRIHFDVRIRNPKQCATGSSTPPGAVLPLSLAHVPDWYMPGAQLIVVGPDGGGEGLLDSEARKLTRAVIVIPAKSLRFGVGKR